MINKRNSLLSILIALVLIGLLAARLPDLKFDYELENFFPQNDPDLAYYREFSNSFGHDNDYLLLGFDAPTGVFQSELLNDIDRGLKQITSHPATLRILSPTNFKTIVSSPIGKIPIPLLHLSKPEKLEKDSANVYAHPFHREMFISKSGSTVKVIVLHQRFTDKADADEYVTVIEEAFKDFPTRMRMAGKANAQTAFVNAVQEDFSRFLVLALITIFLFLLYLFRQLKLVVVALLVAGFSVAATVGLMAATGKAIDVLSSLIPTILLVVAMSDLIHLYAHIQRAYQSSGQIKDAIGKAVRKVGLATLLTSFTTAVGFLTLITINVKPIIDLGIYAAAGILMTLLVTYLLFPTTLFLSNPSQRSQPIDTLTSSLLRNAFRTIIRKRKIILISSLAFVLVGIVGYSKLEINAYLVGDLPNPDQVKSDFLFFDREFSGSKPFTLSVWLKDTTKEFYSKDVITQLAQVERTIKNHMSVGDLFSPVTLVRFANQSLHKGAPEAYRLPESDKDWNKAINWIRRNRPEHRLKKVIDGNRAQIAGFYQDIGSKKSAQKQETLLLELDSIVDSKVLGYRHTGTSLLVDKSHELLSVNLIKGLLIATGIVALIVGLMFRSARMVVIALIPNLLPLLLTAAVMGFFRIPLSLSTAVVFAISFGIVVDDTIHFLSQFKLEMQSGKSRLFAIKAAINSSGQAILLTTIILTSGFLMFCFSNFNTSFYMGLFVSISFITALMADLLLLPLLIILWYRSPRNSK